VELKAVKQLSEKHCAQVMNYLKGTGLRRGLLHNIGHCPKFEYPRIIL
jgi:GxxExxY protein